MPITPPKGFEQAVESAMLEQINNACNAIIYNLGAIGAQAVNIIRSSHAYKDQSGNLTSSTGYVIVEDGMIVMQSGFEPVKPTGKLGSRRGKAFAKSLAKLYPEGITLIVVAGMNYAAYVERRGIGSMTKGEIYARGAVKQLIEQLIK